MTRRRVGTTVAVWLLMVVLLLASDSNPAILVLGGIVAVVATIIFVTFDFGTTVVAVRWPKRTVWTLTPPSSDPRVVRLERSMQAAVWTDSTEVGDTLVELVDGRLLANHQINRATDPEAATARLTPRLVNLVGGTRRRIMTTRELEPIVTDIEAL